MLGSFSRLRAWIVKYLSEGGAWAGVDVPLVDL
jgi:hypothetical protein